MQKLIQIQQVARPDSLFFVQKMLWYSLCKVYQQMIKLLTISKSAKHEYIQEIDQEDQ